ncbi:hypothetical protein [Streptomyces sp. NPDC046685]|uniref:hypothetical protein n=1 Tax=Streptomyces sp. NPDC046685 TaxID=3157202 RepID=UPI0033F6E565
MEIRFEGGVVAESVPGQIGCVPRFSVGGQFVVVSPYADRWGREKFIGATFGSMDWLWEGDDEIRFDKEPGISWASWSRSPKRRTRMGTGPNGCGFRGRAVV